DGVLRVQARERATGLQREVTIDNALARFQREERALARERLERLWGESNGTNGESHHPPAVADDAPTLVPGPAEGQRQGVQARALLEKAQRLLDKAAPQDRADLERMMQRVHTALADRKWGELTTASNELTDALFYLEDT